jgi:excisionase family DNA binding protein
MASRTETIAPITLSIADVVACTGLGRTKVYEAIRDRELPIVKIGKRSLVLDEDLRAWLRRHRVDGEAAPQRSKSESEASAPTDPPRRCGRPRKATEPAPLEAG